MPRQKKSAKSCCVLGCHNNSINSPLGTKFYTFSTREYKTLQREKWTAAVNRKNPDGSLWQPKRHSRICSQHFIGNAKSEHPLSPSFVPTIFPVKINSPGQSTTTTSRSPQSEPQSLKRQSTTAPTETTLRKKRRTLPAKDSSATRNPPFEKITAKLEFSQDKNSLPHNIISNQETQSDVLEEPHNFQLFVCNRYIYKNNSDAETQTFIPVEEKVERVIEKKCCSPDPVDVNKKPSKCITGFRGFSSIRNAEELFDLGGVTFANFKLLLNILPTFTKGKVSKKNCLLIFLIKMKMELSFTALSVIFNVHESTISKIFFETLTYLEQACKNFVIWPGRGTVQATMPDFCKPKYSNIRVIIGRSGFKAEQPPIINNRVLSYPYYKEISTINILLGCAPGVVAFVTKSPGGRKTPSQMSSGSMNVSQPHDLVKSVKKCQQVKTDVQDDRRIILLAMPPFLTADEAAGTYDIGNLRIHIPANENVQNPTVLPVRIKGLSLPLRKMLPNKEKL